MNEEKPSAGSQIGARNLWLMVMGVLVLAFVILGFGFWLYQDNGTYLLDLSRPGYQPEVKTPSANDDWSFSPSGELKTTDYENFTRHFNDKLNKIRDTNAFSEEALSDESLGI
ncbi:MAG: hypothetical protein LBQ02_00445 [Candidatus Nomurabacteria bacterium]|jgi:hypothetical protein|nr:hypothetical protein [Candidatus Nomurabacteria bacterium]